MKKIVFLILALFLVGCTYEGQSLQDYIQNPRSIIRDPHFTEYKEEREAIESQYLNKELTYAEYVEKMDVLEEQYTRDVQKRTKIIEDY